jgi:PAS domain S-box-containing protein
MDIFDLMSFPPFVSHRLRQREYLLQISRAMTARLDISSLLELILGSAAEMVGGEVGLIALADEDGKLRARAVYGLPAHLVEQLAPVLAQLPGLAERGAAPPGGSPVPDIPLRRLEAAVGRPLRQVVNLPLAIENELLGAIYVFRSGGLEFSANDRSVLHSFADQAAIAVRNARLYQQVTAEKRRLDGIIQHSADGVLILDAHRIVMVMNRALCAMIGCPVEQAVGRPCHEVLALENTVGFDICAEQDPASLAPGTALYVEGDLVRPDRSQRTVGVTYSPLYDDEGQLQNIIANVVDITRFREAEEMKSTFVSVISHELKTPVALIKGYAGTLRREDACWDTQTLSEGLTVIEEEADRLSALIDNLLDASRIQAGVLKLDRGDLQISELAAKVIEGFRVRSVGHQFEIDFPADLPLVLADEERVRQVLNNLLDNAVKYSPAGSVIRVGGWIEPERVITYVADQGIGIPTEEQGRLFQRFYRVDSTMRRRTQGAGLGLFLAKAIVEGHGGHIWLRSEPEKGTTVFFSLPR